MTPRRKLSRRSFLTKVAGGSVLAGGALFFVAGRAEAFQCSDSDPSPSRGGDPSGRGRYCGRSGARTGCSDNDNGRGSDPAAYGRRCAQATGHTDNDPTDPTNGGRGYSARERNCTDSDSGSNSDNAGQGRHC